jgi:hypothetical protein
MAGRRPSASCPDLSHSVRLDGRFTFEALRQTAGPGARPAITLGEECNCAGRPTSLVPLVVRVFLKTAVDPPPTSIRGVASHELLRPSSSSSPVQPPVDTQTAAVVSPAAMAEAALRTELLMLMETCGVPLPNRGTNHRVAALRSPSRHSGAMCATGSPATLLRPTTYHVDSTSIRAPRGVCVGTQRQLPTGEDSGTDIPPPLPRCSRT